MNLFFEEDVVQLNLAERSTLAEFVTSPKPDATFVGLGNTNNGDLNFVQDLVPLDVVESALAPESFKSIMKKGFGSLQALLNSSQIFQDSIDVHSNVIDCVMAHHGGLKNFIPSALFESPQSLVASITGDVSLAGLFKAQAIAQGLYPEQPLSARANNRRSIDIESPGFG